MLLRIGPRLQSVLDQLPQEGDLFPKILTNQALVRIAGRPECAGLLPPSARRSRSSVEATRKDGSGHAIATGFAQLTPSDHGFDCLFATSLCSGVNL